MSAAEKYLFETAFDLPEKGGNAKPLPTHTEEEVAHVREQAFQAGHEAALMEKKELEERRIKEIFGEITDQVAALTTTRESDMTLVAQQATQLAVSICRKVLPETARKNALTEIEGMIGECLASIHDEPRIVVRVADDMVDELQSRLDTIAGGFDGKLVLLGDDQMPVTDCAVVWADGGAERNLERLWQDIDAAIDRVLAVNPASPESAETEAVEPPVAADETTNVGGATAPAIDDPIDQAAAEAAVPQ